MPDRRSVHGSDRLAPACTGQPILHEVYIGICFLRLALNASAWSRAIRALRGDLEARSARWWRIKVTDLAAQSTRAGQTVLHEALLMADHNAYHLGRANIGPASARRLGDRAFRVKLLGCVGLAR